MATADALRRTKELAIDTGSQREAVPYGWPIVWDLTGKCYMYTPRANGVLHIDDDVDSNPHMMTREIGIKLIEGGQVR